MKYMGSALLEVNNEDLNNICPVYAKIQNRKIGHYGYIGRFPSLPKISIIMQENEDENNNESLSYDIPLFSHLPEILYHHSKEIAIGMKNVVWPYSSSIKLVSIINDRFHMSECNFADLILPHALQVSMENITISTYL